MPLPPSGHQFEISAGNHQVTVVEVGGGVRRYRVGDRDVLEPYPLEAMCDGAHGAPLIPWPNRLGDGRYRFDGRDYQLALSEPEKHNAIHGLMRWRPWEPVEHSDSRVVVSATLLPMPGYPFTLAMQIDYHLDDHGLTVATTATNIGAVVCPYAAGQHPYLSPGDGEIDTCTLQMSADTRILTDPARQLPIGTEKVSGTVFDSHTPRLVDDLRIDDAFTDLARDADGRAWVRLTGNDGRTVSLWVDDSYPILELYTGDELAAGRRRRGLGAEPMTCPPNGFQTGEHLIRLEPGASVTTTWGVRLQ